MIWKKACFAFGVSILLLTLTACQPEPLTEEEIKSDFPLTQTTITVVKTSHTLDLTELTVTDRQTEGKSEVAYCSYTLSDGIYAVTGKYCLTYSYENGQWAPEGAYPTVEQTISVISAEAPDEMLAAVTEWEEHFSSKETVTKSNDYEKISDTQFQTTYTVSENKPYYSHNVEYLIRSTLTNWFDNSSFYWNVEEGEGDVTETWNLVGKYLFESDTTYIELNIDSFDPATMKAHISYAKEIDYAYFPGETDKIGEISDITISLEESTAAGLKLYAPLKILYHGDLEIWKDTISCHDYYLDRVS